MRALNITKESLKAELLKAAALARLGGNRSAIRKANKALKGIGCDDFVVAELSLAETKTALYRHYDKRGTLLYVGISVHPGARFDQHWRQSDWVYQVVRIDVEWFDNRKLAEEAEIKAIQTDKPWNNIRHSTLFDFRHAKDD